MSRDLVEHVIVHHGRLSKVFGPGDTVPDEWADRIPDRFWTSVGTRVSSDPDSGSVSEPENEPGNEPESESGSEPGETSLDDVDLDTLDLAGLKDLAKTLGVSISGNVGEATLRNRIEAQL